MNEKLVIGIDIAKDTFHVAATDNSIDREFSNDAKGIAQARRIIGKLGPTLVVMESTGGYEYDVAAQLQAVGLSIAIVQPARARAFARACGKIAKTDPIDAATLARYGQQLQPSPNGVVEETARKMKALVARRSQLVCMHTAEKNRVEHARDRVIAKSIGNILHHIEYEIEEVEKAIRELVDDNPQWREKVERLDSVPGIGETTAVMLVTHLPELGSASRKEIAALAALAPYNRDSGKFAGRRKTGIGRREVRAKLYMPMLTAVRKNDVIRKFYERLVQAGKSKKCAIIAAMRKLLTILNAMLRDGTDWCQSAVNLA